MSTHQHALIRHRVWPNDGLRVKLFSVQKRQYFSCLIGATLIVRTVKIPTLRHLGSCTAMAVG